MFSVKTPKIEAMEKDERGNGDALLCISQAVVIFEPTIKSNHSLHRRPFQPGVAAV